MQTTIDLINAANQVHSYEAEEKQAFYIASGINASTLEAQILGQGRGVFETWSQLPSDTTMIWIDEENQDEALEVLEEAGFDQTTLRRVTEAALNGKLLMMPLERALVDGIPRTAWLEIDKETYFTIGVMDSGEHGAMISQAILDWAKGFGKYSIGALFGVESVVWGVCSYALIYDDYAEILAAAERDALELAQAVKDAFELAGKLNPNNIKGLRDMAKDKAKGLLLPDLSMSEGMVAGIQFYLELARQ
jgi:hypothetical protein